VNEFRITPAARQDLQEIQAHFRAVSEKLATHVIERIIDMIQLVADNPGMGHRRDDVTSRDLRFQSVFQYYIVYRGDQPPISIVRVLHAGRDVTRELDA